MLRSPPFRIVILGLTLLALIGGLSAVNFADETPTPEQEADDFPGITLGLTAAASSALQQAGQAFPESDAGFSAYYRVPNSGGGYGLDKAAVDAEIFAPVSSGDLTYRDSVASIIATGGNYTVATLPIINIDYVSDTDKLITDVNVYYDDQGWIVAYLPAGVPSSQVWQARALDAENPSLSDIDTVLLDAINVIYVDGLNNSTPLTTTDDGFNYYHWQHPTAANFLMLAQSQAQQGGANLPVSFAVPATFQVAEVSATLWISQDVNPSAPCAKLTLDDADLIARQCAKGFYHATADLTAFNAQSAHVMKLEQSARDAGASGGMLMLVYATP